MSRSTPITGPKNNQNTGWRERALIVVALIASLVVTAQIIAILIKGEAACFSEGCRLVEGLTRVSSLVFNSIGLGYFLTLLSLLLLNRHRQVSSVDWPRLLLLAGITVEGVLFSYQIFAAQILCIYCLVIFGFVVVMNILAGRTQFLQGAAIFLSANLIFALLGFGPALLLARNQGLDSGTYGVRNCAKPIKTMYLIFSSNCPHCQEVIKALEGCDSCDFHFNPVDRLARSTLPDLKHNSSYYPEANRLILAMLGINEVPVLLVRNPDGFSFIKGEGNIINYIKTNCAKKEQIEQLGSSTLLPGPGGMSDYGQTDKGCEITTDCK